jgi:hypothetical protein
VQQLEAAAADYERGLAATSLPADSAQAALVDMTRRLAQMRMSEMEAVRRAQLADTTDRMLRLRLDAAEKRVRPSFRCKGHCGVADRWCL